MKPKQYNNPKTYRNNLQVNKAINQKPKRNQNKTMVKPINIIDQRKEFEKNKNKIETKSEFRPRNSCDWTIFVSRTEHTKTKL